MEQVALGGGGRRTTRLGFGSAGMMGSIGRRQSLRLLEEAFAQGIRHFDTAPMYGYGQAEVLLGEFLAGHAGQCTVTTKFGIPPPPANPVKVRAKIAAGTVLHALPGVKRRLRPVAPLVPSAQGRPATALEPNSLFCATEARRSLECSLRALRVERIDIWLLHEVHAVDLRGNDALLRMVHDAVAAGQVGSFGVASEPWDVEELLREFPEYCPVTQYGWSALDAVGEAHGRVRILHRALSSRFHALLARVEGDGEARRRWSDAVGMDLGAPGVLARLMLKASAVRNPDALLLFSSTRAGNIRANVSTVEDAGLGEPARRLHEVLRRELAGAAE